MKNFIGNLLDRVAAALAEPIELHGYSALLFAIAIALSTARSCSADIEETKVDYYERGYDQGYSDGWDAGYENDDMGDHYDNTYPY